MGEFQHSVFESCERLLCAQTEDDIVSEIRQVGNRFGLDGFTWARMDDNSRIYSVDERPEEWKKLYWSRGYMHKDAVILAVRKSFRPFTWEESLRGRPPSREQQGIFADARDFGMTDGIAIPFRNSQTEYGFVGFHSGHSPTFHEAISGHRRLLHMFGLAAGAASAELRRGGDVDRIALSHREEECLSWAAAGKSAFETASILSVSEATVKAHLNSVCRKLDATGKLHAVVKGIMLGLISP